MISSHGFLLLDLVDILIITIFGTGYQPELSLGQGERLRHPQHWGYTVEMVTQNDDIQIRHPEKADEDTLAWICQITGHTKAAPQLFGIRWCLDYARRSPEDCFVAVDGEKVVGYIVAALDSAEQAACFKRETLPEVERIYKDLRPKNFDDWRHMLFMRYFDWEVFKGLYAEYPAHLHINLDPAYQRRGIGGRLLAAYEDNLRRKNIPGYHLEVDGNNQVGISFYQKMGLERLRAFPRIGIPIVIAYGRKLTPG